MTYRLIADTAMVVHLAFLVYVALGGFLAWLRPRLIRPHVACALYGLGITVIGWPCPLTHVEHWARRRAGQAGLPESGFIDHYLTGIVYPAEHLLTLQLAVAATVLASWAGHVLLTRRRKRHTAANRT
ncbi:hypothetical protein HNR06_000510 [Nocardiopsis arvandica]|uniref:DUF2784 domain-containing protein n=1 Tax=Nocardiopsis sinuspersici TaxID=501010 RepID=A0A7Y9X831_9ACTN|nr:DUF2784 domain-containing protein [Nocardiopsis sinuspersici]NYH50921.1 hypothetical protein [Nocardiopsis sinuspersici]